MINLTFTGIDVYTKIHNLPRGPEYAVLISNNREGKYIRYPSIHYIDTLLSGLKSYDHKTALHFCGINTICNLLNFRQYFDLIELVDRIQFNGTIPQDLIITAANILSDKEIIFQSSKVTVPPNILKEYNNIKYLVDYSGGNGIVPGEWKAPEFYMEYGMAGGLNPDNVIEQYGNMPKDISWIDMETGVRDDNNFFSIEKVKRVIENVKEIS